jgi:hypothetical protein
MRITELYSKNDAELLALSQFLLSRAEDKNAQKKISVPAFLKMAANMEISLTRDQLIDLSQRPPLNNVIQGIDGDEIRFKGAEGPPTATMTKDQAQATVDAMAKRAAKKDL